MSLHPSATITVKVFPIGEPGTIGITVDTSGPASLLPHEAAKVLRQAADVVEKNNDVLR